MRHSAIITKKLSKESSLSLSLSVRDFNESHPATNNYRTVWVGFLRWVTNPAATPVAGVRGIDFPCDVGQ